MKKTNNSRFGSPSEWQNELGGGTQLYKHAYSNQDFTEVLTFISNREDIINDESNINSCFNYEDGSGQIVFNLVIYNEVDGLGVSLHAEELAGIDGILTAYGLNNGQNINDHITMRHLTEKLVRPL